MAILKIMFKKRTDRCSTCRYVFLNIIFKIAIFVFRFFDGTLPPYLSSCVSVYTPSTLRSSSDAKTLVQDGNLTPSLPLCNLKMTNKSAKLENIHPYCFFVFFSPGCGKIFIKTHSIENRYDIRPENILFAGARVHISGRKFYMLQQ